jgi:hypothetical protein
MFLKKPLKLLCHSSYTPVIMVKAIIDKLYDKCNQLQFDCKRCLYSIE